MESLAVIAMLALVINVLMLLISTASLVLTFVFKKRK